MKSCLEEYRDCTPREIVERYIEGTPQVGEEPVFADDAPRIHGDVYKRQGEISQLVKKLIGDSSLNGSEIRVDAGFLLHYEVRK